jgi:hypothetical protein
MEALPQSREQASACKDDFMARKEAKLLEQFELMQVIILFLVPLLSIPMSWHVVVHATMHMRIRTTSQGTFAYMIHFTLTYQKITATPNNLQSALQEIASDLADIDLLMFALRHKMRGKFFFLVKKIIFLSEWEYNNKNCISIFFCVCVNVSLSVPSRTWACTNNTGLVITYRHRY